MELDLTLVCEELQEITSKWESLGSEACLPPEVLDNLRSDGCTEQDALREVLRHWFQNVKEAGEDMTWSVLLKAVQNIDKGLAERLMEKYVSPAAEGAPEGESALKESGTELEGTQDGGQEEGNKKEEETKKEGAEENRDAQEERMEVAGEGAGGDDGDSGATSSTGNAHVFAENWSKLSKEEIVDRVRGMIYGQAIGDALGKNNHVAS